MAILTAALIGMQVLGGIKGAKGAQDEGEAQAAAREAQAAVLEQQAARDEADAAVAAQDFSRDTRRRQGQQSAKLAAAGVTSAGTPALVAEDIAAEEELTRLRILNAGEVSSIRKLQEAGLARVGAERSLERGRREAGASLIRAGSSVLSTLSDVNFGD